MKVGIISMQRIVNYGSYLQAYALKNTLEGLGHQVEFVDYTVEPPLLGNSDIQNVPGKSMNVWMKVINYLWENRSSKSRKQRTYNRFLLNLGKDFREKYLPELGITEERNYRAKEDVIVIGSDEVFNCLQSNPDVGYSKELFGANANADRVITYAASFGTTTVEKLERYGIKEEIAKMLGKMDCISVRDKNSVEVVKQLTKKEPYYHIDPVFLCQYEGKIPDTVPKKNYIIVYGYKDRITEEEAFVINAFAKKENKQVITLGQKQRLEWEHIQPSPFEVLAYFQHADYIITDTFHGSVFSIKYGKKFAVIVRKENQQKLTDLITRFGMQSRMVKNISDLSAVVKAEYDVSAVQEQIKKERADSITYLKQALHSNHM